MRNFLLWCHDLEVLTLNTNCSNFTYTQKMSLVPKLPKLRRVDVLYMAYDKGHYIDLRGKLSGSLVHLDLQMDARLRQALFEQGLNLDAFIGSLPLLKYLRVQGSHGFSTEQQKSWTFLTYLSSIVD